MVSQSQRTSVDVIKHLSAQSNPGNIAGMARFGINPKNTLGVPIPVIRQLAKSIGKNHELALELWSSEIHEARILACLVADPAKMTKSLMNAWTKEFDSWDVCDQCCSNLFDKTPFAYDVATKWSGAKQEFVKRAGFVMMAVLAVHDKQAPDEKFEPFFDLIELHATDERNFVKKAVNWALRQIGKRNRTLNKRAIATAERLLLTDSKAARWIARDALRELKGDAVNERLKRKVP